MAFDIRVAMATTLGTADGEALAWQGRWFRWDDLCAARAALDALLDAAGLGRGAVGLVARNRPACVAALVAQVASGRATIMIHGAQSPAGIAVDLIKADVPAVIADESDWDEGLRAAAADAGVLAIAIDQSLVPRIVAGADALTRPSAPRDPGVGIELLSSGTTGKPKRVPLAWATLSSAAEDGRSAYAGTGVRAAPQILLHPLGNIAGVSYLLPAYAFAQPMVLLERFTVADWIDAVERYRPTRASLPSAAMQMLLDSDVPKAALSSLQVMAVGGGKLDIALQDRFEARFEVPVLTAFGATEFAGVIANWSLDLYRRYGAEKRGSAGRASANVSLRVVDPETGEALPVGAAGLLEAKVARLGDDWVRTTDLASIDSDGFLFVQGRSDGAINRGGFKVLPETVTAALAAHPAVGEAAVVARADARLGEVPVAAVELKAGEAIEPESLRTWLKDRLLAYQVPAEIRVLERLPRTGSMKVALCEVAALFR